jgi:hypothetical protein
LSASSRFSSNESNLNVKVIPLELIWNSHQENKIVALNQKLYKNTYINNFYSQKDKNYIRDAAGFKMDMGTCVGFADSIIWQNLSFAS